MQCKSCRQAIDGTHPDIRVWSHEKPKTFSVQEVRSLVQDVSIRPFSSERKVYIVPDAHLMRQEAQNALLKTLEEPPEYVVIILLAHTADAMLETIRSRCQMVELAAKDMEYDPELRKTAEEILLGISSWDLTQIRAAIQTLEEFKTDAARILSLFASWYRDILYFKASMDPDGILNHEHLSEIRTLAGQTSYEGIQNVLESIQKARRRLLANVNFDLTMELLLLAMKDAVS
jgi:DNA polymerase-3 subunit delta'